MQISDFFYTKGEVVEELGVNQLTVWRWIKEGKLSAQRLGRQVVLIPKWEVELIKEAKNRK